jgi:osmotically-inducible protein OsmY
MKDRQDMADAPDSEIEVEPFDKPLETDPTQAVEEAEPYFPPTDPVVRLGPKGETKIAGGFGAGDVPKTHAHAAIEDVPSDEAIEDLVHRQLRLDASTAHLRLKVGVLQGVVRLQGMVEDEADAENAMAVAGDVPGVVEVIDELSRPASEA